MFDFLYRADYDDSPEITDDPAAKSETAAEDHDAANQEGISPTERIAQGVLSWQWRRAQINVQIYIMADKYLIEGLKDISKRKLDSNLRNDWDDCGFVAVVSDVYGSQCPPRSDLREILIKFALRHLGTLKGSRQFDDVRKDHPEFVYELSTALIERVIELEKRPCMTPLDIAGAPIVDDRSGRLNKLETTA
ncbi:hypothetical protein AnigIFM63604_004785 [Aspergillus niger]|uniref:Uncharacterized protein n=1 Tax=Aspergillus niger TaxID=5061 RepID=A0A9W6ABU4_ASPNG|nr:hypothetical protein AnigIFM63604_004785 [Aspergillus niger]